MIGLFTVELRGRTLRVNVFREEIKLLGEDGEVLDWNITSDEWSVIISVAANHGFNHTNWHYVSERANNARVNAMTENLNLLDNLLKKAAKQSAEAYGLIQYGKCNGAIGAVVTLGCILDEAKALYGATLALHRSRVP